MLFLRVLFVISLFGFEIIYGAKEVNVALNKPASQLGTFWPPEQAVDGKVPTTEAEQELYCSASDGGTPDGTDNFWMVNLGQVYRIGSLKVTGRITQGEQQLGGFIVYGQTQAGQGTPEQILYNNAGEAFGDGIFDIDVNPERNASIIRIERPSANNIITLCGVEVYEACDDGSYGPGCVSSCGYCMNNASCDKVSGDCPSGCQDGWMGPKCKQRENIALGQAASQSSTAAGWVADRVVDGCTNQTSESTCCSKTQASTDNYLEIYLGATYKIGKVIVYGPSDEDELMGFKIYFGTLLMQMLFDSSTRPYGDGIFEIKPEPPIDMSTLTVRRENSTVNLTLTVCEIQVFEVCPEGFYGDICDQECGNCLDDDTCYGNTGGCPRGCSAGWHGDTCKLACSNGTYGNDCAMDCGNCLDNATCDIIDGSCPSGCNPGYHGDGCDMECTDGTYGPDCNSTCGSCVNGSSCDVISGSCTSCAAGYEGDLCKTVCVSPQFGPDCLFTCNCLNNATCDTVTGNCPNGCEAGWQGDSCNSECGNFTYGQDCLSTCGNCLNGDTCDAISGECVSGCTPGWLTEMCNVACDEGYFGENCTNTCGNCLNNETCHFETGECPNGCDPGWQGNVCKTECSDGTFGANCERRCFCADRVPCNKETGICPSGCDIGITGEFCDTDLNKAVNKTAWQSTTLSSGGIDLTADRAVDGNFEQSVGSRTCSSTQLQTTDQPWWYVDMGGISRIDYLTVYGKEENSNELSGFLVYLSNSTNITGLVPVYDNGGVPYDTGVFNISFNESYSAQFVHITLNVDRTLSLCEVRVFGECADGTFGNQCENKCYCADNVACDKDTGLCPAGGCQAGWTGDQCSQPCSDGTYGRNCEGTCGSCANDTSCNVVSGICDMGCSDGWLGVGCNNSCSSGYYGTNCNDTCGQCKDNAVCNHVTGRCQDGCAAGYKGDLCTTGCLNGTYGEDCVGTCGNCINDTICDTITGACDSGCVDGYVPPTCATVDVQTGDDSGDSTNVGAIIGGIIGGVAAVIIVGVIYKMCQKRSKFSSRDKAMAYYPTTATSQAKSPAMAINQGFHIEEESSYYNFSNRSTKL